MVVFVLPLAELPGELGGVPEDHAPVELVRVGPMAALDFSIGLRATPWNLPVDHPEIAQMPSEVSPKLRAMVRLDALDGHRQATAHFLDELSGRFDGVVGVDPEHAIAGGLIDGRELVEAGVIFVEDMLAETAFVKLGWVLGHHGWKKYVKEKMLENVAGEFNERLM